jgi:hypothetical protein
MAVTILVKWAPEALVDLDSEGCFEIFFCAVMELLKIYLPIIMFPRFKKNIY